MTERKFYKTTLRMVVLSEEPIPPDMTVDEILEEADSGDYVAGASSMEEADRVEQVLDGKQIGRELIAIGSEPGFFQLDDEGNDI